MYISKQHPHHPGSFLNPSIINKRTKHIPFEMQSINIMDESLNT